MVAMKDVKLYSRGRTQTLQDWALETGIKLSILEARHKAGMNSVDILTKRNLRETLDREICIVAGCDKSVYIAKYYREPIRFCLRHCEKLNQ